MPSWSWIAVVLAVERFLVHLHKFDVLDNVVRRTNKRLTCTSSGDLITDFRPISVTPILSRLMERQVVRQFIYPAFLNPPQNLTFADQFGFRPTGSTTAALVYLLHNITDLLSTNPFVIVIALDSSKAFDTVRHSSLLQKISHLPIQDHVYNWFVDYFNCLLYTSPSPRD